MPQVRKSGTAWERRLDVYAYTKGLDGSGWAWEFLRRNVGYRKDYSEHLSTVPLSVVHHSGAKTFILPNRVEVAEQWGLIAFVDPEQSAIDTSVFWLPTSLNSIVKCHARPANDDHPELLSLSHFKGQKSILITPECEHVLIQEEHTTARLVITGASFLTGEFTLSFSFDGIESAFSALIALRDLRHLLASSPVRLTQLSTPNLKYRDYLVALDGYLAQRTYRDIAEVLYGSDRVKQVWSNETRHLKDKVRRAVHAGIELMAGGYIQLLN